MEYELSEGGTLHRRDHGSISTYPSIGVLNLHEYFPWLKNYYLDFEKNYFGGSSLRWASHHYYWALYATIGYLAFAYVGTKIMKNRPAFDLKKPLIFWNGLLAIFSFIGMMRVVPHLLVMIWEYGVEGSLCYPPVYTFGHGPSGFWTMAFIFSKYLELIDTVFIVLRKKPLNFLHYYHHATVLLYTWDAYVSEQPAGLYFGAMNYVVHTFMYSYYFFAAVLNSKLSWGIYVTMAQISQMFVGIGVTVLSLYYTFAHEQQNSWNQSMLSEANNRIHYISKKNLVYACLMYSTYLFLFAQYFVKRYSTPSKAKKTE